MSRIPQCIREAAALMGPEYPYRVLHLNPATGLGGEDEFQVRSYTERDSPFGYQEVLASGESVRGRVESWWAVAEDGTICEAT